MKMHNYVVFREFGFTFALHLSSDSVCKVGWKVLIGKSDAIKIKAAANFCQFFKVKIQIRPRLETRCSWTYWWIRFPFKSTYDSKTNIDVEIYKTIIDFHLWILLQLVFVIFLVSGFSGWSSCDLSKSKRNFFSPGMNSNECGGRVQRNQFLLH